MLLENRRNILGEILRGARADPGQQNRAPQQHGVLHFITSPVTA
jgi:hypothetical protein